MQMTKLNYTVGHLLYWLQSHLPVLLQFGGLYLLNHPDLLLQTFSWQTGCIYLYKSHMCAAIGQIVSY